MPESPAPTISTSKCSVILRFQPVLSGESYQTPPLARLSAEGAVDSRRAQRTSPQRTRRAQRRNSAPKACKKFLRVLCALCGEFFFCGHCESSASSALSLLSSVWNVESGAEEFHQRAERGETAGDFVYQRRRGREFLIGFAHGVEALFLDVCDVRML